MDLHGFDRIRLVGDEDCGVGLECIDCPDGGRPLAYYEPFGSAPYGNDPKVVDVATVVDLLTVGREHLDTHHP